MIEDDTRAGDYKYNILLSLNAKIISMDRFYPSHITHSEKGVLANGLTDNAKLPGTETIYENPNQQLQLFWVNSKNNQIMR